MATTVMDSGEFAGWTTWAEEPFEHETAGPFYFRIDANGPVAAFRVARKHMNAGGVVHGGCLMTFADSAIFVIAARELEGGMGVTLNLTADFLGPAKVGQFIEARGRVVRGGGKTIFVEGMATADGTPVLRFNGIIRKVGSKA